MTGPDPAARDLPPVAARFDWGDDLPRLESPRPVLRGVTIDDAPALWDIFSDPEVTRYWSSPAYTDPRQAAELVREIEELFAERTLFQWDIARREDDRVVGTATIFQLEPYNLRAEVGFALGRAAWGQGLMREALTALFDFAFDTLALHRLEADVDPRNERCLRLLEGHGFRREGLLRERHHVAGEIQDSVILGLLAGEWRTRHDASG
ncbi:MAG TPA: GNAT family protein [Thermoanaerobaculia bacterium]|nr:GNAT family protein [Thermoanaerobaculia bacterium]